jgi:hypothetical protein
VQNKNCQYCVDGVIYGTPTDADKYKGFATAGVYVPDFLTKEGVIFTSKVSSEYRGEKYVFSPKTVYSKLLDRYVNEYTDENGKTIQGYTETIYKSPIFVSNLLTNNDFKTTSGWTG